MGGWNEGDEDGAGHALTRESKGVMRRRGSIVGKRRGFCRGRRGRVARKNAARFLTCASAHKHTLSETRNDEIADPVEDRL